MKKLNKALLALFGGLFTLAACSDATDMELKNPADLTRSNKSEAYYAKLREYKKHSVGLVTGLVLVLA